MVNSTGSTLLTTFRAILLEKLIAHPDNPNRMSKANLAKLVRNIERTSRYEPIVVRPHPQRGDCFQIINGEHRCKALAKLDYKTADCIVWDIDDEQTDVLLATLNRLGGSDELDKKLNLLNRLRKRMESGELARLLPQTAKQIEHLTNLKMPSTPVEINAKWFSNPMVFFVDDTQQGTIENALSLAEESRSEKTNATPRSGDATSLRSTRAAKRAAALAQIAEYFLSAAGGQEPFKI